jgi:curved DNA-binding protein CbpA
MARSAQPGGDPYQVLGVTAGASRQDIARAYRRAAQAAHPDARPADPGAAARFRALTDAYDLLSDAGRRADYDRRHPPQQPPAQHVPARPRPGAGTRGGPWPVRGPHLQSTPLKCTPQPAR